MAARYACEEQTICPGSRLYCQLGPQWPVWGLWHNEKKILQWLICGWLHTAKQIRRNCIPNSARLHTKFGDFAHQIRRNCNVNTASLHGKYGEFAMWSATDGKCICDKVSFHWVSMNYATALQSNDAYSLCVAFHHAVFVFGAAALFAEGSLTEIPE